MNMARELRMDIIETLFKIEDVEILQSIHHQLAEKKESGGTLGISTVPNFMEAVKPIRGDVSLEKIMVEQNYEPIRYDQFREKAAKIEWQESLEDLLKALD